MAEEQYDRLNEYLNECFVLMEKKDPIFIDKIDFIAKLNGSVKCIDIKEENSIKNNLTFDDIYLLGREIIETIDKTYLEKYDSLISNGELDFDYEGKYISSFARHIYSSNKTLINIKRKFNYDDVIALVHEFFHSTNITGKITYNTMFLTEFISIYFEEYAKNYLINEKKVNINEISENNRVIDFMRIHDKLYQFILVLLTYEKLGNINKNTFNDVKRILELKDDTFEKECLSIVKMIEEKLKSSNSYNEVYNEIVINFISYKYIVGIPLAFYALEHCKLEDIVALNKNINSEEYAEKNIDEVLETINIKLDDNFIDESLNLIYKSVINVKDGVEK